MENFVKQLRTCFHRVFPVLVTSECYVGGVTGNHGEAGKLSAADHCQLMAASFSVTSSSSKEGSSSFDSTIFWAPAFCVCPSPFKFSGSNFNGVPSSGSPGSFSASSSISVASSSL